jgi:hypothetical protein
MRPNRSFFPSIRWEFFPVKLSPLFNAGMKVYPGRLLMTSGGSGSSDKRTVEAERRRHAEPPSGGRRRAETPQRRDTGSGCGFGGGAGPSSGLPLPRGKGPTSIIGIILMLVVLCIFFAIQYFSGNNSTDQTSSLEPTAEEVTAGNANPLAQSNGSLQEPTLPFEPTAPSAQVRPTKTAASVQPATSSHD